MSDASTQAQCFLLIKTNLNAHRVLKGAILPLKELEWAAVIYGPYQIAAYVTSDDERSLTNTIETLRAERPILELDVRRCKRLPEDDELGSIQGHPRKAIQACLLINVDYREEKERIVTVALRKLQGVRLARAMWGPSDIIAVVEAQNHEAMRNLICDEIKVMKGVANNCTLFCYPD